MLLDLFIDMLLDALSDEKSALLILLGTFFLFLSSKAPLPL